MVDTFFFYFILGPDNEKYQRHAEVDSVGKLQMLHSCLCANANLTGCVESTYNDSQAERHTSVLFVVLIGFTKAKKKKKSRRQTRQSV